MKWKDKIKEWENGIYGGYPSNITKRFFYETSACDNKLLNNYKEVFIENEKLEKLHHDYSSFNNHLKKSKNKYGISFLNISKSSLLIIPVPRARKNFTTIKDFMDNASKLHQREYWKFVASQIKLFLHNKEKIYISTHGLGIPYFHLRLDITPKYYTSKLK
tara:strand:+ start:15107 stop:15589 length:483 start_codon:yes stop_codon:yes gene_type:complete